ncbi:unnamed protein product, partial [Effrenium voratum]
PVNCLWCLAYEWSKWHLSQRLPAASAAPALAACAAECVWVAFAMPVENAPPTFAVVSPSEPRAKRKDPKTSVTADPQR